MNSDRPAAKNPYPWLWMLIGVSALGLFIASSLKHALYQSASFDLGIFDQALYLISQGQVPFSTLTNYHILADHAAFILYPLALLYRVYPDVHWLFLVQAIALSIVCYPTFKLALLAGLTEAQGKLIAVVSLLYPVVFNVNLFDFHTEVIAFPSILWMVLAARSRKFGIFCLALVVTLSCKDALSLTVSAIGLWMILFEGRRKYGILALISGTIWFFFASKFVLPTFYPEEAVSVSRYLAKYSDLGGTAAEILQNIVIEPKRILSRIFSLATLEYLALLCAPIIYLFAARSFVPLIQMMPAVPTLAINILVNSGDTSHRNLIHQYSLPLLPFIILCVIACFQQTQFSFFAERRGRRFVLGWATVAFLVLSRISAFFGPYYAFSDTYQASNEAVSRVLNDASVLTTAEIVPHLSQRTNIEMTDADIPPDISQFETVLLNTRHPGWKSTTDFSQALVNQLSASELFQLDYERDDIYLFTRSDGLP